MKTDIRTCANNIQKVLSLLQNARSELDELLLTVKRVNEKARIANPESPAVSAQALEQIEQRKVFTLQNMQRLVDCTELAAFRTRRAAS